MISPFLRAAAGDPGIAAFFAPEAEAAAMIAFEAALAEAQAELGLIPASAARAIAAACAVFVPDPAALAEGMVKDGVVAPAFVAALRQAVGAPEGRWLHFGATSQDVVDTALTLRLAPLTAELDARLARLIAALERARAAQGDTPLMAHTRMQRALPFTAGDKIDTWVRPLERHRDRLAALLPRLLLVQLGGPVGTRSEFGGSGDLLAARLAGKLGLGVAAPWHTARDGIVEFGDWLSLVAGTLGKIGADVALMAQDEIGAVRLAGGGRSSAMPHKSNPVAGEFLVALARLGAGLVGTLHQALVHENERSGAAWALEWLVLPQLAVTTGAALRHAIGLMGGLTFQAASVP